MSNNATSVKRNRSSRLDSAHGHRSSSSGMLRTTSLFGSCHRPRGDSTSTRSCLEYVNPTGRDESNTSSISSAQRPISASLDNIDGHKSSKRNVVMRLKNTIQNVSRSLSTGRLSSNRSDDSESLLENMEAEELPNSEEEPLITSRLLEKSNNTFIIQFRRKFSTQELGVSFSMDEIGLYISDLAKERHLESIQEYLRVKDRIVSLQGIPAYYLDISEIREALRGSHVITVKIVRPSRR
nr:expressed protein [Hymenolepis microstoma]